jgi:trans-aconitate 2-methyltransferase
MLSFRSMEHQHPDPQQVADFYDGFSEGEQKTGLNLRHYLIFRTCLRYGLRRNHKVLEIGCGIGQLTGLLAKFVRKGHITATDISQRSIGVARRRVGAKNVQFLVSDMRDFDSGELYDLILLPDVLEHIPAENHAELFLRLSGMMHPDSVLIIHLPHPRNIEFYQRHDPGALQIIDQALYSDMIARHTRPYGLYMDCYRPHSVFNREEDYAVVVIRKWGMEPVLHPLWKYRIALRKQLLRAWYLIKTL